MHAKAVLDSVSDQSLSAHYQLKHGSDLLTIRQNHKAMSLCFSEAPSRPFFEAKGPALPSVDRCGCKIVSHYEVNTSTKFQR